MIVFVSEGIESDAVLKLSDAIVIGEFSRTIDLVSLLTCDSVSWFTIDLVSFLTCDSVSFWLRWNWFTKWWKINIRSEINDGNVVIIRK